MLTLHNLSKFDDASIITCKARNQVESVWRESDTSDVLRVDGELIKFWWVPLNCAGNRVPNWRGPLARLSVKTNCKPSGNFRA